MHSSYLLCFIILFCFTVLKRISNRRTLVAFFRTVIKFIWFCSCSVVWNSLYLGKYGTKRGSISHKYLKIISSINFHIIYFVNLFIRFILRVKDYLLESEGHFQRGIFFKLINYQYYRSKKIWSPLLWLLITDKIHKSR